MALQTKEMNLVLSSDAKPRLKWTPELHQRFVDAVNQLGGPEKATPKSLMRIMGIHGLTLYHLKSHLQKYRLGKSQQSQAHHENKQEDYRENQRSPFNIEMYDGAQDQINESLQIAEALKMQMEVQRKLHEQIEVQRHLQLRIEAQGKYLQSVLKKAQETIAGYHSCQIEVEHAKAELSQLVSMVDNGSTLSALTESEGSVLKDAKNKLLRQYRGSLESSLTSAETSDAKEDNQAKNEFSDNDKHQTVEKTEPSQNSVVLSLMEMHPSQKTELDHQAGTNKRGRRAILDADFQLPSVKRSVMQDRPQESINFGLVETFDLNRKCLNDFDPGPKVIDLNCKGVEQYSGSF